MALASSALTAMIPLFILVGAVLGNVVHYDVAEQIIRRYKLSGAGAAAVDSLFSSAEGTRVSVGVFGALFLVISTLSFARASQRLFEQSWELTPLSVRNTRNGLCWILTLGVYGVISALVSAVLDMGLGLAAALAELPLTAVFMVWTGWILSARRIDWRDLIPFGITVAVLTTLYSLGATVYLPRLFNSYAGRYGVVGAVFAMISAIFAAMLVIVASAALGREVRDELGWIRQGRRPSDHEVRQQWDSVVDHALSRWRSARRHVPRRGPRD